MPSIQTTTARTCRCLCAAIVLLVLTPLIARSIETFPRQGWQDRPDPIAGSDAVMGGELAVFAGQYPKSLNYYLDNNSFTVEIFGAMFETLLSTHPITLAYKPNLAEKWTLSDDRKHLFSPSTRMPAGAMAVPSPPMMSSGPSTLF